MKTTILQPAKQWDRLEGEMALFYSIVISPFPLFWWVFLPWLQVIHQLKQLGTVWQDVLPVSIYCKAMGNLLNTAITEIIAKIMMLEVCLFFVNNGLINKIMFNGVLTADVGSRWFPLVIALVTPFACDVDSVSDCLQDISSEDGEHLHTLCQTIIEEGPLVFIPLAEEHKNKKYQEEVPLYVKKWSTFKELVIVLRANLQEIVDRWDDRSGTNIVPFTIICFDN